MVQYSNPRLVAEINDWPIGGGNRGICKFEVEDGGKKGKRIVRTTTDKHGRWCKPKKDTYAAAVCVVDGDDGKTYIMSTTMYGFVKISRADFMDHENVWEKDGERFKEMLALVAAAK